MQYFDCLGKQLSEKKRKKKKLKEQLTKKNELLIQELTFNSTPAGTTIGLNDKEWGQMGVTIIAGTDGCIIEAPAATA